MSGIAQQAGNNRFAGMTEPMRRACETAFLSVVEQIEIGYYPTPRNTKEDNSSNSPFFETWQALFRGLENPMLHVAEA